MDVKRTYESVLPYFAAAVPLLELYLLRSYYRWRVDLYADSGFMIGLGVAYFALCIFFLNSRPLTLRRPALLANLLLCTVPILQYRGMLPLHIEWVGLLWVSVVVSAMCIFTPLAQLPTRLYDHAPVICFALAVYAVQIFYFMMRYVIWFKKAVWYNFLAPHTTETVRSLIEFMGYKLLPAGRASINHEFFRIDIYTPCSGVEGAVFFVAVFSCMMMLDYRRFSLRQIALGYALGIAMMFVLNILRITTFFMFGVWTAQNWGNEAGLSYTVELFHSNIGWLLYALGIAGFFAWFYRDPDKKPAKAG